MSKSTPADETDATLTETTLLSVIVTASIVGAAISFVGYLFLPRGGVPARCPTASEN